MSIILKASKAVRNKRPCRFFISGVSGSGKTLTSLLIARGLVGPEGKILLLDTENESARLYDDAENVGEWDHYDLDQHSSLEDYLSLFKQAEAQKYNCVILDSATHFWDAVKERASHESKKFGNNSASGWMVTTPLLKKNIFDQLRISSHIIYACRSKTEYVYETNDKGKITPRKIGLAPEFKSGIEFEFDIIGHMNNSFMHIEKSRYLKLELHDTVIEKPGVPLGEEISAFLSSGYSIKYGLSNLYFESPSKCETAIKYLETRGAKLIDDYYKIVEINHRLPDIESRESWQVKIIHNDTDIANYKENYDSYFIDNPPVETVNSIEELGDRLAEIK